jgi:ABC-type nitrate/sulfonate/bicarbonate transport system substrate-binding protein
MSFRTFVPESALAQANQAAALRFQASWIDDSEFLGYFAALDADEGGFGFYKKAGLRVEHISGGPEVIPETSLVSGRADVAATTPETTAKYIVRDRIEFKIIGAQYQRNPIGVISLAEKPIRSMNEVRGKRLAVAAVNRLTIEAVLKLNSIPLSAVKLVPYAFDADILINGGADATVDFVTNLPYVIESKGGRAHSFLLFDARFKVFNDTIVVLDETIRRRRQDLVRWMAATIQGWEENYRKAADGSIDYKRLPTHFYERRFKKTGRALANEIEFNRRQLPLMQHPDGFFSMSPRAIQENLESLRALNLDLKPDVFDTSIVEAARELLRRRR